MRISLFLVASVLLTFSCTQEFIDTEDSIQSQNQNLILDPRNSEDNYEGLREVVLGEEINNPYTVAMINQAQSLLYENAAPKTATHHYVQFRPSNHNDIAKLSDWSFENNILTLDYPMHYRIVREGDFYLDPEVTDSLLVYQYASIPVNMEKPDVAYEMMEELYLDESNPFLIIQAYILTGHNDRIKNIV